MQRVICTNKEMRNKLKRFVRLSVLIAMLTGFSSNLFAYIYFQTDGIWYNGTSDSTVEVSRIGYDFAGAVIIPSSVQYNGVTYSVTSIRDNAFQYRTGLTSIEIPNSVTSIGYAAFRGCTGITSIEIPNSVTSIDRWTFAGCTGLTSIEIPNSVTSIGYAAFQGCTGLEKVTIGNSVTSIGDYAFDGCEGLTSIEIPNSVTSIGIFAFYSCIVLTKVTIGNSVTDIGRYVLGKCPELDTIIVLAIDPPTTSYNAFDGVPNDIPLIVPCGSQDRYRSNYYWKGFTNIQTKTYDTSVTMSLCYGETFNDRTAMQSGVFVDTLQSTDGCDSIVTIDLTVYPIYDTTIYVNTTVDEKGEDYYDTVVNSLQTINGCDSVVTTITLYDYDNSIDTIYKNITIAICQGEAYLFDNNELYAEGTYTHTVNVNKYRDSIITLTLTVNPTYDTTISATICKGQTYNNNGFNTNEAGTHTLYLTTINGCDSIVKLDLTVTAGFDTTITMEICSDNVIEGTFVQELQTDAGCDSIIRIVMAARAPIIDTVTLHDTIETTLYDTITLHDTITVTQTVHDTVNTVDTLTVTEYDTITLIDTVTLTQTDTVTLTDTITLTQTDTVTLTDTITLTQTDTVTLTDTITLTLYDTINTTDTITLTLYDTVSLTDTLYLHDTITPCGITRTYIYAEINAGETYMGYGFTESDAGEYTLNLQTEDGCDSIVTLILQVTAGIEEIQQERIISIYPNPAHDKVTIHADGDIKIIDNKGQVVREIKSVKGIKDINVSNFEAGVYYINVGKHTQPLIIE